MTWFVHSCSSPSRPGGARRQLTFRGLERGGWTAAELCRQRDEDDRRATLSQGTFHPIISKLGSQVEVMKGKLFLKEEKKKSRKKTTLSSERLTRTLRQRTFNSVPVFLFFFPQGFYCDFVLVTRCRDLRLLCLDAAFQDSRIVKLLRSRDDRALRRFRGINTRQSAGKHRAARGRGLARSLPPVRSGPTRPGNTAAGSESGSTSADQSEASGTVAAGRCGRPTRGKAFGTTQLSVTPASPIITSLSGCRKEETDLSGKRLFGPSLFLFIKPRT